MAKRETPHPICEGRTVYTEKDFKNMVENKGDHVITPTFNEQMAIVRNNVKNIIAGRNLLDSYVAQMIGWDKTHYSKWMTEPERNLSLTAAAKLSDLLGCSLHELVMGEPKPIKLPRLCALLYTIIKSRAVLHADCDKLIAQSKTEEVDIENLVYKRLQERADDKNEEMYQMIVKWNNAELKQVAFKLQQNGKYIGRLPMIYAICVCLEDSPDYLLRQNFGSCEMTANGKTVEDRYTRTIGNFAALDKERQEDIIAELTCRRYF